MKRVLSLLIALVTASQIGAVELPKPYGATPTPRQLAHQELELYAFCHFTVDTFTDREWGTGGESETVFNPTAFDANQIVDALKAGGLKGVILTCKHHDGFTLWPSKFTEHSVKNSPWKNGKGDVVAEFAKACKRADVKFGVYLSPWDRNQPEYGRPGYVAYFQNQLRELLTNYGPIFEVWFDGANGGTGYYKGKVGPVESKDVNERRNIDASKYYEWPTTWQLVRELQPGANMFGGPDCRWVGNERGWAPDPCRATIEMRGQLFDFDGDKLGPGTQGGNVWCPAEVDVSIRPGWFWHASENSRVRSPENLMQIYVDSVGHGAMLNLNVPPDRRGILHENDVESLRQFGKHLRATFGENLAAGAKPEAGIRGGDARNYGPGKLLDNDRWSAWVTDDNVTTPEVTFELAGAKTFNLIRLRENIRLGLRVEGVAVDAWQDGGWKEIAKAESIGACHLWRVPKTTTGKVRIRVTKSAVCPALSDFGLFLEPEFDTWIPPVGGDPKMAMKAKWKVVSVSYEEGKARNAIDGDPGTMWHTHGPDGEHPGPQDIVVDLSKTEIFSGFTYLPRHDGTTRGIVDQYAFYVSADGKDWGKAVVEGEFGNIKANPVEQTVQFDKPVTARYFKFVAKHSADGDHITVAEIGLVIKDRSSAEKKSR
jgi:alpha-L-fucosidase